MHKTQTLPPQVRHILFDKGTEPPFSGDYCEETARGTYLCRGCGLALYRADAKFISQCGWPSFDACLSWRSRFAGAHSAAQSKSAILPIYDDEIPDAVYRQTDVDGRRTEILCARCHAHLGHVFSGEGYTAKNLRHCVNSLSVDFVKSDTIADSEEALVAGGCFWGVQSLLDKLPGVVKTEVGYTGGHTDHPRYEDVCRGDTGHFEATRIIYDPAIVDYETLIKYFFEIHDPTQANGQGPDIGLSYRSAIFYYDDAQKKIAQDVMQQLRTMNYDVVTELFPASIFWKAETYHQEYYVKTGKEPYCHMRVKRF